jgi:hypothetical protein
MKFQTVFCLLTTVIMWIVKLSQPPTQLKRYLYRYLGTSSETTYELFVIIIWA